MPSRPGGNVLGCFFGRGRQHFCPVFKKVLISCRKVVNVITAFRFCEKTTLMLLLHGVHFKVEWGPVIVQKFKTEVNSDLITFVRHWTRAQPRDWVTCTDTRYMLHHWHPSFFLSRYSGCQSVAIRVHLALSSMSVDLSPTAGGHQQKREGKKASTHQLFIF